MKGGRFVRLREADRPTIQFQLDGRAAQALAGDTVLTAILTNTPMLRRFEFGEGWRAGFCLMGACQDCWVWTETGARVQACQTPIREGAALRTTPPGEEAWPTSKSS